MFKFIQVKLKSVFKNKFQVKERERVGESVDVELPVDFHCGRVKRVSF